MFVLRIFFVEVIMFFALAIVVSYGDISVMEMSVTFKDGYNVIAFILEQMKSLTTTIMGDAVLAFPVVVGMVGSVIGLTFTLLGRKRRRRSG